MKDPIIFRIVFIFLGLLFFVFPVVIHSVEIDSSIHEIDPVEKIEVPRQMTQKEMNDLFGEDPYLGQTSYLQSPDGFSQKKN